jgi:hypothetical protein
MSKLADLLLVLSLLFGLFVLRGGRGNAIGGMCCRPSRPSLVHKHMNVVMLSNQACTSNDCRCSRCCTCCMPASCVTPECWDT